MYTVQHTRYLPMRHRLWGRTWKSQHQAEQIGAWPQGSFPPSQAVLGPRLPCSHAVDPDGPASFFGGVTLLPRRATTPPAPSCLGDWSCHLPPLPSFPLQSFWAAILPTYQTLLLHVPYGYAGSAVFIFIFFSTQPRSRHSKVGMLVAH